MIKVINSKTDSYDIYIGRGSKWGNPFVMKSEKDRNDVVLKYTIWINSQRELLLSLPELKDKRLGCFCAPRACHGDVLKKLAESRYIKNWFSNMERLDEPIKYQNTQYHTVENFYQAMKLPKERTDLRAEIATMNPYSAKKSIRDKEKYLWDEEWTKVKSLDVMEYALRIKFRQPKFKRFLDISKEIDVEIIEFNNWGDKFWGVDLESNEGENNLGKILMRIRG